MSLRCPACKSEQFYLVVEHTWSFKVESIGTDGVTPGEKHDAIGGKELVCDECGFGGWLDEYHHVKSGVIPLDFDKKEEEE
jgi:hypothetical protein